ncbi:MAG: HNH endonuclease [Anaerolineae bacterium]|nr:HNH endonuclease [Anaerolineae bacterium]
MNVEKDSKRNTTHKTLTKAACIIGRTVKELLSQLTEAEMTQVEDDPYAVIEVLVSNLPAATLRALKEEIATERRQPIPAAIRRTVLMRDGQQCVKCKTKRSLHLHHYKPVAEGGENAVGNLVTLCANCHMAVHQGLIKVRKPKAVAMKASKE